MTLPVRAASDDSASESRRPRLWSDTSSEARVGVAILLALGADWSGYWRDGPTTRYALMVAIVCVAVYAPAVVERRRATSRPPIELRIALLVALVMCVLSFATGASTSATAVFWLPAVLPWVAALRPNVYSAEADTRLLSGALRIFSCSALLSDFFASRPLVTQETHFILAGALCFAISRRDVVLASITIASLGIAIYQYPAATYLLGAVAVFIWYVLSKSSRSLSKVTVGLFLLLILASASAILSLLHSYFQVAGKADNTQTRLTLLQEGWQRFLSHPVVGDLMSGTITVEAQIRGIYEDVPTHNGLLSLGLAGGLVFAIPMTIYLVRPIFWTASARKRFGHVWESNRHVFVFIGCTMASGFVTLLFNPVLESLQTSSAIYAFLPLCYAQARRKEADPPA